MKTSIHLLLCTLICVMTLTACSDGLFDDSEVNGTDRIQLMGEIDQLAVTRVNDNGFANGDVMGVYIVDY